MRISISTLSTFCLTLFISATAFAGGWGDNSRWNEHRNFSSKSIISAGGDFSVAIVRGQAIAWGNNASGELGDQGMNTSPYKKNEPVNVRGFINAIEVSAGGSHCMGLSVDGKVWIWGDNFYGQIGDGTDTDNQDFPYVVTAVDSVVGVSAGGNHSLAVTVNGNVYSWGRNHKGQLGRGSISTFSFSPQMVPGLTDIVAVAAGGNFSLALRADGTVWAWGDNAEGQLGDGTVTVRSSPVQVSGLSMVANISAGDSSGYAVLANGTAWAWGSNDNGQLGNNSTTQSNTPIQISSLSNVEFIEGGGSSALARKADGSMWAWGNNTNGQLANGSTTQSLVPVEITSIGDVVYVSAGGKHGMALKSNGDIVAWGENTMGQVGNLTYTQQLTPVGITGTKAVLTGTIQAVAAPVGHSLALKPDGNVFSWGNNVFGQLGNNSGIAKTNSSNQVAGLSGVIKVAAGQDFSVALKADGTVWAWGKNNLGQLGNGSTSGNSPNVAPGQVGTLTNIIDIVAGPDYCLALHADGTLWFWGYNLLGILGDGSSSTSTETTPHHITQIGNIIGVAAGQYHIVALKADGSVWAWGRNTPFGLNTAYGVIGNNTNVDQLSPVQVSNISNMVDVAAGLYYSMALGVDGQPMGWGSTEWCEFGDGVGGTYTLVPMATAISGRKHIEGGDRFSKYLGVNGILFAAGANPSGVLADSVNTAKLCSPIECNLKNASTPMEQVLSCSNSSAHAVTVRVGWTVCVVGENLNGQLGDGTYVSTWVYNCNSDINCEPGTEPSPAVISFADTIKCGFMGEPSITPINLIANAPAFGSVGKWNVLSGGGTITSDASSSTSAIGWSAGLNRFEWTVSTESCPANRDTVEVMVWDMLGVDSADAGVDLELCITNTTQIMNASYPDSIAGFGTWTRFGGTANVSDVNDPRATILALSVGITYFQWTVTEGYGTCFSSDAMKVEVFALPTTSSINPLPNDSVCAYGCQAVVANSPSVGSGLWYALPPYGDNNKFDCRTCTSANYCGLTAGMNEMVWKISNGPCPASSDTVFVDVRNNPLTPNAGIDQSLCDTGTLVVAGNNPFSNSAQWTVSPCSLAIISTPSSQSTSINNLCPGVNNVIYTLSNGFCSKSDTMKATVYQQPTMPNANTCNLDTVCYDSIINLCGSSTGIGTGLWTLVSPTGGATICNASSNTTCIRPKSTTPNIELTLQWEVTNGPCGSLSDNVVIYAEKKPNKANAGIDFTGRCYPICLSGNNPGNSGQSGFWTHLAGSAIFDPTLNATVPNACLTDGLVDNTQNDLVWTTSSINGSCLSTDAVTINYTPPAGMINTFTPGGSFFLTGGLPDPNSYVWYQIKNNGDTVVVVGEKAAVLTPPVDTASCGSYYATATTGNGECLIYSDVVDYWSTTSNVCFAQIGIAEELLAQTNIVPNPTTGEVFLTFSERLKSGITVSLYNATGELVLRDEVAGFKHKLDLSTFENGIYYVRIGNGSSSVARKIVKMK